VSWQDESHIEPAGPFAGWRNKVREIVFETDTVPGRVFDVILIVSIVISVIAVMADSVRSIRMTYGTELYAIEWFFTIIFTIEYVIRLAVTGRPLAYARSFYGVVDLLAIVPTYLSILLPGSQYLLVIRVLRVLRVFRILKIVQYLGEANVLVAALRASHRKIIVFLFVVITMVIVVGSIMYLIEGEENGFTSIPVSVYWAIVTLTTVGYGDIAPITVAGKILASFIMVVGYGIIAVPTGIVTVEMSNAMSRRYITTKACPECSKEGHDMDARHCKFCGAKLGE